MPRPPGIIDRVNYVVDFWEDPCSAPWTVYAELALPAAGIAALTLLEPSPTDVLRAYVKPRGARSAGRFGGYLEAEELEKSEPLIKDTSELIGEKIPFKARFDEPVLAERFRFFWIIDGAMQRVLWYFMIADVISEFLFDWTTLIMQSQQCSIDRGGSALLTRALTFGFPANQWQGVEPMTVEKSWGAVHGDTNGNMYFDGETGMITGGMAVVGTPGVTAIQMRLYDYTAHQSVEERDAAWPTEHGDAVQWAFKVDAKPNHIYGLETNYQGTIEQLGIYISNAVLNGFGSEMQNTPG